MQVPKYAQPGQPAQELDVLLVDEISVWSSSDLPHVQWRWGGHEHFEDPAKGRFWVEATVSLGLSFVFTEFAVTSVSIKWLRTAATLYAYRSSFQARGY